MTEDELRHVLRNHGGWSIGRKTSKQKKYYHAVRRIPKGGGIEDVYLCPASKLENITEEDIVAKLHRQDPERS